MRNLFMFVIAILLMSFSGMAQSGKNCEVGVINDADGYTNVRSKPDINSEILSTIAHDDFICFSRNGNSWWKLKTCEYCGDTEGYIHSSRIVPLIDLSIPEIESIYGERSENDKQIVGLDDIIITVLNARRKKQSRVPDHSGYMEIQITGKSIVRKYYPDIWGLGGWADVRYVPFPSESDFRFFVKNGDYDGRTIIIARDGRIADIEGGAFAIFNNFVVSQVGKDCCGEPIVWDLSLWEKTYDIRDDRNIKIDYKTGGPEYDFYTDSNELSLEIRNIIPNPIFMRLNEEGKFIQTKNLPETTEKLKLLPF